MRYAKLDENKVAVEIVREKRRGYILVADTVVCGMQLVGGKWRSPPAPPVPYDQRRLREKHPPVGDQLDAAFKARKKTQADLKLALAALQEGDTKTAIELIVTALTSHPEQAAIDDRLQAIKDKHPKP